MYTLYGVVTQEIPNHSTWVSRGTHQHSDGALSAWKDYSEAMHMMEFLSECILRSHCTLYMRLGLIKRNKASCLIGFLKEIVSL